VKTGGTPASARSFGTVIEGRQAVLNLYHNENVSGLSAGDVLSTISFRKHTGHAGNETIRIYNVQGDSGSSGASDDYHTSDLRISTRKIGTNAYTDRFTILGQEGYVGIGTTSPGSPLHLTSGSGYLKFDTSGSVGSIKSDFNLDLYADDGGNNSASYQNVRFFTAGSNERMRIDSAGNVGIGTTSPSVPLHVVSSGTTSLLLESTDAGAADAPILELYRNSASPANGDDLGQILWSQEKADGSKSSVTKMYAEINTVDNSDRLMINVSSSGGSGLNDYEYIRLDGGVRDIIFNETGQDIDVRMEGSSVSGLFFLDASTDRIGIGTTSPNQPLTVEGTMSLKEQANANADTAAYGQLWVKTATPNELYFTTDAGNDIQLTSGTSIAGGGGGAVSAVANGSNNRIATFSSADALNGEANLTFNGSTLTVTGAISATTKSFDIEHPTKEGMRLHHGSLEGPEHGVYIRGILQGDTIELPDYWTGLVDEDTITVQLTANKTFQQLYVDTVKDNKVHVKELTGRNIDCFYFVQAERKDTGRMVVEY
jgi:hypothetical protein